MTSIPKMPTVILGAGLAGLTAALTFAAQNPPHPVTLVAAYPLGEGCSSDWAQGGIAAAVGHDDSAAIHTDDTLKAGVGLCDALIAQQTTGDGKDVINFLIRHGTAFDKNAEGTLRLGLEGAHTRRRIVHAADRTGHVIIEALVATIRAAKSITVIENAQATDLLTSTTNGVRSICGVVIAQNNKQTVINTDKVILATGGAAALWQYTTNPLGNWGSGLALAARVGAELSDLEFMQFHPTAFDIGQDPMPLASEALRGEGALLINETGECFMEDFPRQDLEPRDVVARAIWKQRQQGHQTFLDVRPLGEDFAMEFPNIAEICASAGIDPENQPIPIAPAAHYHMGGVKTDAQGRTNVNGLWACGEVAATGLHGANRLASNSLLEAVSFGQRVARDCIATPERTITAAEIIPKPRTRKPQDDQTIRAIMAEYIGVLRDEDGIKTAIAKLRPLATHNDMALVGLMVAHAALKRGESRGAHTRTDHPTTDAALAQRQHFTLQDIA